MKHKIVYRVMKKKQGRNKVTKRRDIKDKKGGDYKNQRVNKRMLKYR